ncbi:MAG TPA: sulfite exporter TauE/SafE family protein [Limnobacter sp.]|nr:sulfite exporter TauE/SafE family protein [Limnobacter sp.]
MVSLSLLASALALGLLAMPHCGSMCACQFAAPWLQKPFHFQLGRFLAYTAGGVLAGGVSAGVVNMAASGLGLFKALNWMLMAVLLFSALLLLWRGQTLGTLVQERIQLSPALQRKLGGVQRPSAASALKAGLLWLLMPCGVLWAGLMLAYLSGSAFQGGLIMAVFAATSAAGLQLVSSLRKVMLNRAGEALVLRTSGGLLLLGLVLMAGRQAGLLPAPAWLQSLGLCL